MAYTSQGFADGQVLSAAKLTNIEQAILDNDIIAQGTSGGWDYVKYANGWAYCQKSLLISCTGAMDAWGSAYMSKTRYTCGDYPFAFVSAPVVSVTLDGSGTGNYITGSWVACGTFGTETTPPSAYVMNSNSNADYDRGGYLVTQAFGRWK